MAVDKCGAERKCQQRNERDGGQSAVGDGLALTFWGDLQASLEPGGNALRLSRADGTAMLRYRGLSAQDASGRELRAWLQVQGGQLWLRVDDDGAQYPIVVDPFVEQAKLTASGGAAGDVFGSSVAVSGDTVVVGAPYASSATGAAYVFTKPAAGWSLPAGSVRRRARPRPSTSRCWPRNGSTSTGPPTTRTTPAPFGNGTRATRGMHAVHRGVHGRAVRRWCMHATAVRRRMRVRLRYCRRFGEKYGGKKRDGIFHGLSPGGPAVQPQDCSCLKAIRGQTVPPG